MPMLTGHIAQGKHHLKGIAAAVVVLGNALQLRRVLLIPELEGFQGTLQVSLLAITPAHHILQQLELLLGGGGFAQLTELGRRREPSGRRQLRGLQRQATQKDRDAIKDRWQAQVGGVGGIGHRTNHRQHGASNRQQRTWREQIFHRVIFP